jgi:hypothetical protein
MAKSKIKVIEFGPGKEIERELFIPDDEGFIVEPAEKEKHPEEPLSTTPASITVRQAEDIINLSIKKGINLFVKKGINFDEIARDTFEGYSELSRLSESQADYLIFKLSLMTTKMNTNKADENENNCVSIWRE